MIVTASHRDRFLGMKNITAARVIVLSLVAAGAVALAVPAQADTTSGDTSSTAIAQQRGDRMEFMTSANDIGYMGFGFNGFGA